MGSCTFRSEVDTIKCLARVNGFTFNVERMIQKKLIAKFPDLTTYLLHEGKTSRENACVIFVFWPCLIQLSFCRSENGHVPKNGSALSFLLIYCGIVIDSYFFRLSFIKT